MGVHGYIVVIKRTGVDHKSFPLTDNSCVIGRYQDCDIRVQLPAVSKFHCIVNVDSDGKACITNLNRKNSTFLNDEALTGVRTVELFHKDIIMVADRKFRWEYPVGSKYIMDFKNLSRNQPCTSSPHVQDISMRSLSERSKKVSFGPYLSPEHFDLKLPPSTPVLKGEKPYDSEESVPVKITGTCKLNLSLPLKTPEKMNETPSKGLLKRRSPTPIKPSVAKKLGIFPSPKPKSPAKHSTKPSRGEGRKCSLSKRSTNTPKRIDRKRKHSPSPSDPPAKRPKIRTAKTPKFKKIEPRNRGSLSKSSKKSVKKMTFADAVKKGKMSKVPLPRSRKSLHILHEKAFKKKVKPAKSPSTKFHTAIPKSFNFGVKSTGHANSPAPLIIHKKIHKTPQTKVYRKGQKGDLKENKKMPSPNLGGLKELIKTPKSKSPRGTTPKSKSPRGTTPKSKSPRETSPKSKSPRETASVSRKQITTLSKSKSLPSKLKKSPQKSTPRRNAKSPRQLKSPVGSRKSKSLGHKAKVSPKKSTSSKSRSLEKISKAQRKHSGNTKSSLKLKFQSGSCVKNKGRPKSFGGISNRPKFPTGLLKRPRGRPKSVGHVPNLSGTSIKSKSPKISKSKSMGQVKKSKSPAVPKSSKKLQKNSPGRSRSVERSPNLLGRSNSKSSKKSPGKPRLSKSPGRPRLSKSPAKSKSAEKLKNLERSLKKSTSPGRPRSIGPSPKTPGKRKSNKLTPKSLGRSKSVEKSPKTLGSNKSFEKTPKTSGRSKSKSPRSPRHNKHTLNTSGIQEYIKQSPKTRGTPKSPAQSKKSVEKLSHALGRSRSKGTTPKAPGRPKSKSPGRPRSVGQSPTTPGKQKSDKRTPKTLGRPKSTERSPKTRGRPKSSERTPKKTPKRLKSESPRVSRNSIKRSPKMPKSQGRSKSKSPGSTRRNEHSINTEMQRSIKKSPETRGRPKSKSLTHISKSTEKSPKSSEASPRFVGRSKSTSPGRPRSIGQSLVTSSKSKSSERTMVRGRSRSSGKSPKTAASYSKSPGRPRSTERSPKSMTVRPKSLSQSRGSRSTTPRSAGSPSESPRTPSTHQSSKTRRTFSTSPSKVISSLTSSTSPETKDSLGRLSTSLRKASVTKSPGKLPKSPTRLLVLSRKAVTSPKKMISLVLSSKSNKSELDVQQETPAQQGMKLLPSTPLPNSQQMNLSSEALPQSNSPTSFMYWSSPSPTTPQSGRQSRASMRMSETSSILTPNINNLITKSMKKNKRDSVSSVGQNATAFDFSALRTPDITMDKFVSPLESTTPVRMVPESISRLDYRSSVKKISKDKGGNDSDAYSISEILKDPFISPISTTHSLRGYRKPLQDCNMTKSIQKLFESRDTTDLSEIRKLFDEASSPNRSDQIQMNNSPTVASAYGTRKLTSSPNTLSSVPNFSYVEGIRKFINISKANRTPEADYSNVHGLKRLMKTPRLQKEAPECDYSDVHGLKRLMKTPRQQTKEPEVDYTNVHGLRKLMKTPREQKKAPEPDYSNVHGLKRLMKTPRQLKEAPKADYSNVHGLKRLMKTPRLTKGSPKADYTDVRGIKKLLEGCLQNRGNCQPNSDYDLEGLTELLKSPEIRKLSTMKKNSRNNKSLNDIQGLEELVDLLAMPRTPFNSPVNIEAQEKGEVSVNQVGRGRLRGNESSSTSSSSKKLEKDEETCTPQSQRATPVRRGRPRKNASTSVTTSNKRKSASPVSNENIQHSTPLRRGRPRKYINTSLTTSDKKNSAGSSSSKKNKHDDVLSPLPQHLTPVRRGRPKNNSNTPLTTSSNKSVSSNMKKKEHIEEPLTPLTPHSTPVRRGRPKKNINTSLTASDKKSAGSASKKKAEADASTSVPKQSTPIKRTRQLAALSHSPEPSSNAIDKPIRNTTKRKAAGREIDTDTVNSRESPPKLRKVTRNTKKATVSPKLDEKKTLKTTGRRGVKRKSTGNVESMPKSPRIATRGRMAKKSSTQGDTPKAETPKKVTRGRKAVKASPKAKPSPKTETPKKVTRGRKAVKDSPKPEPSPKLESPKRATTVLARLESPKRTTRGRKALKSPVSTTKESPRVTVSPKVTRGRKAAKNQPKEDSPVVKTPPKRAMRGRKKKSLTPAKSPRVTRALRTRK